MNNDLTSNEDIESSDNKAEYEELPENYDQIKIEIPEERVPTDNASSDLEDSEEDVAVDLPDGEINGGEDAEKEDSPIAESDEASLDAEDGTESNKNSEPDDKENDNDGAEDGSYPGEDGSADIEDSAPESDDFSDAEPQAPDADSATEGTLTADVIDSDTDSDLAPKSDSEEDDYVQISLFDDDDTRDNLTNEEDDWTDEPKKYDPDHPRFIDAIFDFVELFIFSLVAVLLATTFLFRHTVVDGSSMEQTLYHGEHLIISNLFYTPQRGDIIVCVDYSTIHKKPIVKRIIGLPGDNIKVYPNGEVYVNDVKLTEDYVYNDFTVHQEYVEKTVEEGKLFVMGDHRNVSSDSRTIGTIDIDSVLGKVIFRFYPFDKFGKVE